jgi:hypothetical protein
MKTYGGVEVYSSAILNLGTRPEVSGQLHAPAALFPEKQSPVHIVQDAPKSVWTLRRKLKHLYPTGPLGRPARSLVPISTELSRLPKTLCILRSAC